MIDARKLFLISIYTSNCMIDAKKRSCCITLLASGTNPMPFAYGFELFRDCVDETLNVVASDNSTAEGVVVLTGLEN